MIRIRPITNVLGIMLLILGFLMIACLGYALYFQTGDSPGLLRAGSLTMGFGALLSLYRRGNKIISKREGYLIVALGWIAMVIFGALPYLTTGVTTSVINAIFESASGFTTTGATTFPDVEILPKGLLLWRSLTQWIGGMGIIVLTVAIFPLLGIGGIELFVAEAPGPTSDKIHPRITVTARRLWYIYLGLTLILFVLLRLFGMTWYDALNHAFTTMATGGFSTYNGSAGHFPPAIQYLMILFMFLAGTNYTVMYYAFTGKPRKAWASDEFRAYIALITGLVAMTTVILLIRQSLPFERAFRETFFMVVSLITTTGYVNADYTSWGQGLTVVFFILLFSGACAGSTSGGIKLVRHMVFVKNSVLEFKRLLHPRALIRIKMNGEIVAPRILTHILVFLLIYLGLTVIGAVMVSACGIDFTTALAAVASSIGNVGPGIGEVGPTDTFALLPQSAKIILAFLMLLGRLELFTILVLFTPYFWKAT